jgi:serine protease Do
LEKESSPLLPWAIGLLKFVAIVVGLVSTLLSLMSVVGLATDNGWVRGAVAVILAVVVPMFVADRLLPSDDSKPMPGLVTDVFSLAWLSFGFLFTVALHGSSGPWLGREADRLASAGHPGVASIAYVLAGLDEAHAAAGDPLAPAGSASGPSASASASAAPAASAASASAAASGAASSGAQGSASAPSPLGSAPVAPSPADAGAPAQPHDAGTDASATLGRERTPAELFKALGPSVVTLFVKGRMGEESSGTGFLLDHEGTIATNHHVIARGTSVLIKFQGGQRYESVELLADSEAADLALLRIDFTAPDAGPRTDAEPLTLGDSDAVVVGERAISIGNPLGLEHTLTDGLVSARRLYENRTWIQMSVPVSPGNSGGPIFNMRGEVIGITTQQVLGGAPGRAQNLNLAVPVNELKKLISTSYPSRRKFGERAAAGQW